MKELLGYSAFAVSVAANIPYIFEIVHGQAKPQRISWLMWTVLGGVYFFSTIFDTGATWFTAGELVGPVTIFALSIKYGSGGIESKLDIFSLTAAATAFGLLFVVEGVLLSLILALFIDIIGITLTIRKLRKDPTSESRAFWGLAFISGLLAVASLESYVLVSLLFPVYVIIISLYIVLIAKDNDEKINKPELTRPF